MSERTPAAAPPAMREVYLTPLEVAEQFRASKMTVYRLIATGELRAVRFGRGFRIPESGLDEFLKCNTVTPGQDVESLAAADEAE
jgi:excisionase family DNA binding protein